MGIEDLVELEKLKELIRGKQFSGAFQVDADC
jgi:hypothetical protein